MKIVGSNKRKAEEQANHSNKRNKIELVSKFQKVGLFIKANVCTKNKMGYPLLSLSQDYWFEKLDPEHRSNSYLKAAFDVWEKLSYPNNFIIWLNNIEKSYPSYLSKKSFRVSYLFDKAQIEKIKIQIKDGKICDNDGHCIDTRAYTGKQPQFAAYVINKDGEMLLSQHVANQFHHSSFTGGDRVRAAGMVKIIDGKIVEINNLSGHYFQTSTANIPAFYFAMHALPQDIFEKNAIISSKGYIFDKGKLVSHEKSFPREVFLQLTKNIIDKNNESLFFMKNNHEKHLRNEVINVLKDVKEAYTLINQDSKSNTTECSEPLAELKTRIELNLNYLKSFGKPSEQIKAIIKWVEESYQEIYSDSELNNKCNNS